jgi:hypothetical protein
VKVTTLILAFSLFASPGAQHTGIDEPGSGRVELAKKRAASKPLPKSRRSRRQRPIDKEWHSLEVIGDLFLYSGAVTRVDADSRQLWIKEVPSDANGKPSRSYDLDLLGIRCTAKQEAILETAEFANDRLKHREAFVEQWYEITEGSWIDRLRIKICQ